MYSVADYGSMIADKRRMQAFAGALRHHITSDSVVIDIGTGTGVFALLAARFGARRIYAIETEPVIGLARQTAKDSNLGDRIVFIQSDARRAEIPEKADVIVSDIGGVLPWHGNSLATLAYALHHFLAPGGRMLPNRDRISAAIVEAPSAYDELFGVWGRSLRGIDLSPALRSAVNAMQGRRFSTDQLLTSATLIHVLDYETNQDPNLDKKSDLVIKRKGIGHGIAVWFDRTVSDGFEFANGPGSKTSEDDPANIYGHAFFPWPQPVPLSAGMTVRLGLKARLEDDEYVWCWNTDIHSSNKEGDPAQYFRQSSMQDFSTDRTAALKTAPRLSECGEMTCTGLGLMQDGLTLGDIATQLSERYPRRFSNWNDALAFAAELSRKFG